MKRKIKLSFTKYINIKVIHIPEKKRYISILNYSITMPTSSDLGLNKRFYNTRTAYTRIDPYRKKLNDVTGC